MDENSLFQISSGSNRHIRDAALVLQRIGRHHVAFLKGYLEGLDVRHLAELYLETVDQQDIDLRVIYTTLDWIRSELRTVAKRFGKPSVGRAIMINPDQLVVAVRSIPTLEEFREERDPYEMYSEADLIELFEEAFSGQDTNSSSKSQRNIRLRARQAAALVWLQEKAVVEPGADDHVEAWLVPNLARKLVDHGVYTIRDLITSVNEGGFRWYKSIPTMGEKSAMRIMRWIALIIDAVDLTLGPQTLVKRSQLNVTHLVRMRPREQAIVPLEYFHPREDMDGSRGENRGERNKSGVDNDYDAIQLWLSSFEMGSNTWRSYRKEAERFLLWSILERGKPISSMNTTDCLAYRDFMWDLGRLSPATWKAFYKIDEEHWLGVRNVERFSSAWRPFEKWKSPKAPKTIPKADRALWVQQHTKREGVLSPSSQRLALTILKSMCEWLTRRRYLDSNPWDGVKPKLAHAPDIAVHHSFTQTQWAFLLRYLDTLPRDSNYYRLRFVMTMGYATGLRLSEMTCALRSDLIFKPANQNRAAGWILVVIGKGKIKREVPFPSPVMDVFLDYLAHRGYPTFDEAPQDCPLIDSLSDMTPHLARINKVLIKRQDQAKLSESTLHKSLKAFFKKVAAEYAHTHPEDAKHMAKASTHWLRHTSGSHAVANGVPIEVIQANFGHASVDTTSIYITAEIDRRMTAMENFAIKALSTSNVIDLRHKEK